MDVLRGLLAERRMRQRDAAEAMGIGDSTLGRYLNLKREMGVGAFAAMCRVLEVERAEVIARAEARMAAA